MIRFCIGSGMISLLVLAGCGPAQRPVDGAQAALPAPEAVAPAASEAGDVRADPGLMEALAEDRQLSVFLSALEAGGFSGLLSGPGPFTVLAPHDDAFAELPDDWLDDLLKPENEARARRILGYHVLPGQVMAADVPPAEAGLVTETIAGLDLSVRAEADGAVHVNGGRIVRPDRVAGNGVIHVIDTVLIPRASE